jgi:hypothetical protein
MYSHLPDPCIFSLSCLSSLPLAMFLRRTACRRPEVSDCSWANTSSDRGACGERVCESCRAGARAESTAFPGPARAAATGGEGKAARAAGHVRRTECHSPNPIRVAADSCSSAAASSMRGGRPLVPHPRRFNLVPTAGSVPGFPLVHRPCSTVRSAVAHDNNLTFD